MTKYIVLKSFTDNVSGVGYNSGNTFESDDLERVSFLAEKGFIQAPSKTSQEDNEPTIKELKEKAKELGIDGYSKLNKEELIAAIETAEAAKASD